MNGKAFDDSLRAWQLADPFLLRFKHEHVVAPPRLQRTLPDDKKPALLESGFSFCVITDEMMLSLLFAGKAGLQERSKRSHFLAGVLGLFLPPFLFVLDKMTLIFVTGR